MVIVSIIGKSGSGKTTLIERLIPELKKMGYKVATVKHDAHCFEVDKVGKDSWRHKNAGAEITVVSSAKKVAIFADAKEDSSLEYICEKHISGVDIVLAEGYRKSKYPKIEAIRSNNSDNLLCNNKDNLVAIVSDYDFDIGVPIIKPDNICEIARVIEEIAKDDNQE